MIFDYKCFCCCFDNIVDTFAAKNHMGSRENSNNTKMAATHNTSSLTQLIRKSGQSHHLHFEGYHRSTSFFCALIFWRRSRGLHPLAFVGNNLDIEVFQ